MKPTALVHWVNEDVAFVKYVAGFSTPSQMGTAKLGYMVVVLRLSFCACAYYFSSAFLLLF